MARLVMTPEGKVIRADEKYTDVPAVDFTGQGQPAPVAPSPASSSSSAQPMVYKDGGVPDTSSSMNTLVNFPKSSSTATAVATPQPKAEPKPAPNTRVAQPKPASTDSTPAVQSSFKFEGGNQTTEAPVEEDPEKKAELAGLAVGTAASTVESPRHDKYQTVFNWLRGNDPTMTPWTDFVLHGPRTSIAKSNNPDMQAAQFEQQILKSQNPSNSMNYAQVRLRQQYQQQWNNLLQDWNRGYYSGDEQTEQAFYEEANRLLGAMEAAGMDTSLLRKPSINAGGFSQGYNKNLADPYNTLVNLDETMGEIWANAKNNPDWLKTPEATTLFDKLGEKVVLDIAQSKGAIADAEKVRIQVEMMDPDIRRAYDHIMFKFFRDNKGLAALANQYQLTASARQTVNSVLRDIDGSTMNVDKKNRTGDPSWQARFERRLTPGTPENAQVLTAMTHVFNAMQRAGQDVPPDLMVMFNAFKNGIDSFKEYVLQDAPVNMGLIWNLAQRSRNEAMAKYNGWAQRNGKRFGWKYRSSLDAPDNFGEQLYKYQGTPDFQSSNPEIYSWQGGVTHTPYGPASRKRVPTRGGK